MNSVQRAEIAQQHLATAAEHDSVLTRDIGVGER
jgi:hypothetical protein